jgi:hypothetical protein
MPSGLDPAQVARLRMACSVDEKSMVGAIDAGPCLEVLDIAHVADS